MPKNPLTKNEMSERSGKLKKTCKKGCVGEKLPDIDLIATNREIINLKKQSESTHILLFFYPGNKKGLDYPELMGCTPESCNFRNSLQEFLTKGIQIFGVSMQSHLEQLSFKQEQELSFDILSDIEGLLCKKLGINEWHSTINEDVFSARETIFIKQGGEILIHVKDICFEDIDEHVSVMLNKIDCLPLHHHTLRRS